VALDPLPVEKDVPYTKVQAWAELVPFAAETFDAVICATSLDHVLCLESCLRELSRVLRTDGVMFLWTALFVDRKWFKNLFPDPLFSRADSLTIPADDALLRYQTALTELRRRAEDPEHLEKYANLLVDDWHFRHLPTQFLKTMPQYGLEPETIEVWEDSYHYGSIFLNAFVRFRKVSAIDRHVRDSFIGQLDLLTAQATIKEKLATLDAVHQKMAARTAALEVQVTTLNDEVNALKNEVDALKNGTLRRAYQRMARRLSR